MKNKKISFFNRIRKAITKFDEYRTFAEENVGTTIKYILKLLIIFSFIVTIVLSYKIIELTENEIKLFKENCPEFKLMDNILTSETEENEYIRGDETGYFAIILNSEKENLSEIEKASEYQRVIGVLKNKIIIKSSDNIESSITYDQLNEKYNINNINKQTVLEFLYRK